MVLDAFLAELASIKYHVMHLGDVILKATVSEKCNLEFSPGLPARLLRNAASCTNMVSSNHRMRPKTRGAVL